MDRLARPSRNYIFRATALSTSAKSMGYVTRRYGNCRRWVKGISLFVNADLCGNSKVWSVVRGPQRCRRGRAGLDHAPKSVQELLKSLSHRNSP